jgi:hypothetical protein
MMIIFKEKCSDCDTPVIDIITADVGESFDLGRIFQKMVSNGCEGWMVKQGIRVPIKPAKSTMQPITARDKILLCSYPAFGCDHRNTNGTCQTSGNCNGPVSHD